MMSEKILITREQADALRDFEAKGFNLEIFIDAREYWTSQLSPLKSFTIDEFAKLLYKPSGYEIKPEYKVGDWVITSGHVAKIIDIQYENHRVQYDSINNWQPIKGISRYATPGEIKAEQERQLWKNLDREPNQFKIGDVGLHVDGSVARVESHIGVRGIKLMYKDNELLGFYPAESFISFEEGVSDE